MRIDMFKKYCSLLILFFLFGIGQCCFAQNEKSIYHNIKTDASGKIIPWFADDPGKAYSNAIQSVWHFWDTMRIDLNGLPYYMNHQVWNPGVNDPRGIGGDQFAMALRYKRAGLRLAYHNRNIEFTVTEHKLPYDILLQYTNPEFLTFQMDIWWVRKGGQWPLDFIEKYPERFEVCHIKTAGLVKGNEEVQNLDNRKVLAQSKGAGFKHFVLENEPGIDEPFTYFQKSYALINSYF